MATSTIQQNQEAEIKRLKRELEQAEYVLDCAERELSEAENVVGAIKQNLEQLESVRTTVGKVLEDCLPFHLELKGCVLIETEKKKKVLENKEGEVLKEWNYMPSLTDLMEIIL